MDIKFILIVSVVIAVIMTIVTNVNKYKDVRRRNPKMTSAQAFSRYMDETIAEADAAKDARRAREAQRIKLSAEQADREMKARGFFKDFDMGADIVVYSDFSGHQYYYWKNSCTLERIR